MIDTFLKIVSLVDRSTRWQALGVIALSVFGVLLETIGVGLIFPFVKLIIDPASALEMPWIQSIAPFSGEATERQLIIFFTAGLLGVFVAKNAVLLIVCYVQARYSLANMRALSLSLYRHYLNGPYSIHLVRNSADLIQNIFSAANSAFTGGFMGFLTLASEVLLMIGIAVVLIVIDPWMTLAAGSVVGGAIAIFYWVFSPRIAHWGKRTLETSKGILKTLQQGLHSIKEIKILGREGYLISDYERPLDEFCEVNIKKQVMNQIPRIWVETIIVVGILSVILFILARGGAASSLLAIMSVFAAAAFRLIPSMNRILLAINRVNDAKHSIDVVSKDIAALKAFQAPAGDDGSTRFSFSGALRVEDLSFQYDTADAPALKNIDFILPRGESLGLVGPSGAGKTTLVDIILGLLEPTSGRVMVDGADVSSAPRAWQGCLGYVPQTIYLIDDTLRRNIALGLEDHEIDEKKITTAVRLAQLEDVVPQLPQGLDTNVGEQGVRLSGGQRQRVGIARALYRDPDVLIFDEATSSLDSETENEINSAIERLSGEKTVIIIAHRLSTVRTCDRLIFLEDGRIEDTGTFDELTARNDTFRNFVQFARL